MAQRKDPGSAEVPSLEVSVEIGGREASTLRGCEEEGVENMMT